MPNDFENRPKRTEFITPPNHLKRKVGAGGLNEEILEKAQAVLESRSEDFLPLAELYLEQFSKSIQRFEGGFTDDEVFINDIGYYTIQIRAGAGMFNYSLVEDMCSLLIEFSYDLETVNDRALEVINGFHASIRAISTAKVKGNAGSQGKELLKALHRACMNYRKDEKA